MVRDKIVLKEAYGDGGRAYFIRLAPGAELLHLMAEAERPFKKSFNNKKYRL